MDQAVRYEAQAEALELTAKADAAWAAVYFSQGDAELEQSYLGMASTNRSTARMYRKMAADSRKAGRKVGYVPAVVIE